MTLNAIQTKVQDIVGGVQSPNFAKPTLAHLAVPVPGKLTMAQPEIFVWGATWTEKRTSIPRAAPNFNPMLVKPGSTNDAGWKERAYSVTMWVYAVEAISDNNRDNKFPVLIEQIMNALRMVAVPIDLTDLITGEQSHMMNIGEEFAAEYDVDRSFADQRTLRNECRLDVAVLEQFQF